MERWSWVQNGDNRCNPTAGEVSAAKNREAGTLPDVKQGQLPFMTKGLLWLGYKTDEIKPILEELTGTTLAEEKAKKKGKQAAPLASPAPSAATAHAAAESADISAAKKAGEVAADQQDTAGKQDTARPAASSSQANDAVVVEDVEVAAMAAGNADSSNVAALAAVQQREPCKGHIAAEAASNGEGASSAAGQSALP